MRLTISLPTFIAFDAIEYEYVELCHSKYAYSGRKMTDELTCLEIEGITVEN